MKPVYADMTTNMNISMNTVRPAVADTIIITAMPAHVVMIMNTSMDTERSAIALTIMGISTSMARHAVADMITDTVTTTTADASAVRQKGT